MANRAIIGPVAALCLALEVPSALASDRTRGLRVCPEAWIVNRMPTIIMDGRRAHPEQYYILAGRRREIHEFDRHWVRRNCRLRRQTVW